MKSSGKLKLLRVIGLMSLLFVLVTALFGFGVEEASAVALAAAPLGTVTDGTVTTETVEDGSTINEFDYDKHIVRQLPHRTPLDTIFRERAKKMKVSSIEVPFYQVDTKPFKDVMTSAVTAGDSKVLDIPVADIDMWSKHDTVLFNGVAGYDGSADNNATAHNQLTGRVLSVDNSANTIKVQALNGYKSGTNYVFHDNIADATVLLRMAKAEPELAMQTTPYSILPFEEYNYCQNFMAQIEESEWQKMHKQKVNWDFSDYSKLNIYDMRATKEMSFLWGGRSKIQDAETKELVYTTGGVSRYITKTKTFDSGSSLSIGDFSGWKKELFEDNSGSETRHAFIGSTLWKRLEDVDFIQRQLQANKTEVVFGVRFAKIEFGNEVIYLHKHRLMSERGWGDYGIFLDMNHVSERAFQPLKETKLDLKTSGQKNANAVVIHEVSCPIVKYPNTHMIVKPA